MISKHLESARRNYDPSSSMRAYNNGLKRSDIIQINLALVVNVFELNNNSKNNNSEHP